MASFSTSLLAFPRGVLETRRKLLEDGRVVIARANQMRRFHARFSLAAAMNPCVAEAATTANGALICDDFLSLLVASEAKEYTFEQADEIRDAVLYPWREAVVVIAAEKLIDHLAHIGSI
jgi:hypothetical protein